MPHVNSPYKTSIDERLIFYNITRCYSNGEYCHLYNKINITFPALVIVENIIPRNMIINLGCASVDNHIPRDDIFDYHPRRECNIYIIYIVELLSEQNTSFDDTSMKFTPYVLYMTHIQNRFLATSISAIFKMAAKKQNGRHFSRGCM